jgi:hypothetical protein
MAVSRSVTLVLVDGDGVVLGALPAFDVERPFWQETEEVVAGARERFGVDAVVLRILSAERPYPPGGAVTYLAQTDQRPPAEPTDITLTAQPKRVAYAEINGPATSLQWAAEALGLPILRKTQLRTWNLSTIWRLDTADGPVWLKQVPPFLAHEAAVLRWVGAPLVPEVLAADDGKILLADVPGNDLYGADLATRAAIAASFHPVQATAAKDLEQIVHFGVPDERGQTLVRAIEQVVAEHGTDPRLDEIVAGLPGRFAAIEACGLPDTLVHGDFHPGNVRGDEHRRAIIDWGDSFVGNPAFDIMTLSNGLEDADRRHLVTEWAQRWRAEVPGCEPERALEEFAPIVHLRGAVVYNRFVTNIEPAEHPYHAPDVSACLDRALTA